MSIHFRGFYISFSPLFFASAAFCAAADVTAVYAIGFAVLHELCHIAAAAALRVPPRGIRFCAGHIALDCDSPPPLKLFFISLAGPLCNLALFAALFKQYLSLAAVNAALAAFNLLPVVGLDGGNIIDIILTALFGETGARIAALVSKITAVAVAFCVLAALAVSSSRAVCTACVLIFIAVVEKLWTKTPFTQC